jgi:hypothetical protein
MELMIYSKQFVASSINIRDGGVILLHDSKQAIYRTGLAISLEQVYEWKYIVIHKLSWQSKSQKVGYKIPGPGGQGTKTKSNPDLGYRRSNITVPDPTARTRIHTTGSNIGLV